MYSTYIANEKFDPIGFQYFAVQQKWKKKKSIILKMSKTFFF